MMAARTIGAVVEMLVISSAARVVRSVSIAGVVSIAVAEAGGIGAISRRTIASGAISCTAVVGEVVSTPGGTVSCASGIICRRGLIVAGVAGGSVHAVGHLDNCGQLRWKLCKGFVCNEGKL